MAMRNEATQKTEKSDKAFWSLEAEKKEEVLSLFVLRKYLSCNHVLSSPFKKLLKNKWQKKFFWLVKLKKESRLAFIMNKKNILEFKYVQTIFYQKKRERKGRKDGIKKSGYEIS